MILTDDPAHDFDQYDREQYEKLQKRPRCAICGEPIQDDVALKLYDEWICDKCIEDNRRVVPDPD
jgi:formylmethanofuran dehydrogenase subunit E